MDNIQLLMHTYRKLKAERNALDLQMNEVKAKLEPAVEAEGGKWTDGQGYARMVERSASVSYNNANVDRLAVTWSESSDPIMQSCGTMLLDLRKEKAAFSYLQVK